MRTADDPYIEPSSAYTVVPLPVESVAIGRSVAHDGIGAVVVEDGMYRVAISAYVEPSAATSVSVVVKGQTGTEHACAVGYITKTHVLASPGTLVRLSAGDTVRLNVSAAAARVRVRHYAGTFLQIERIV